MIHKKKKKKKSGAREDVTTESVDNKEIKQNLTLMFNNCNEINLLIDI
jgi:hypothetical protein